MASIRSPKDFWAGAIYLVFGAGAIYLISDYGMGSATRMGPGYFPTMLGGLLLLIGATSLVRSFFIAGEPVGKLAYKPMLLIVVGTILFGLLARLAGLAVVVPLLVLITAYASIKFRWGPMVLLALGLTVFCALVFVKGLGVPLPLLGSWFGG